MDKLSAACRHRGKCPGGACEALFSGFCAKTVGRRKVAFLFGRGFALVMI